MSNRILAGFVVPQSDWARAQTGVVIDTREGMLTRAWG